MDIDLRDSIEFTYTPPRQIFPYVAIYADPLKTLVMNSDTTGNEPISLLAHKKNYDLSQGKPKETASKAYKIHLRCHTMNTLFDKTTCIFVVTNYINPSELIFPELIQQEVPVFSNNRLFAGYEFYEYSGYKKPSDFSKPRKELFEKKKPTYYIFELSYKF